MCQLHIIGSERLYHTKLITVFVASYLSNQSIVAFLIASSYIQSFLITKWSVPGFRSLDKNTLVEVASNLGKEGYNSILAQENWVQLDYAAARN
jgi:hypothetical protein